MNRISGNGSLRDAEKPRFVRKDAKKANIEAYSHELLTKIGPIRCVGDVWYQYRHGVWSEVDPAIFLPVAWKIINTRSERNAKQVLDAIHTQMQIEKGELFGAVKADGSGFLINCANGVVRISKNGAADLVEHNRKYMFTLQIEANYSEARCPRFLETLHRVLPAKENRALLLHYAASCLIPDSRFEKMLFCTGSGGNGKSTIWEAIAKALGDSVVGRISYHDICANNRKYVWKLERMLMNLSTETLAKPVEDNAIIRAIVSGESFDTDRMYRDSFNMKTNAKLVFAMNHMMRYEQGSEADLRRISMIHFGEKFEVCKETLELERVLRAEQDGIFSMLVRRLPRTLELSSLPQGDQISEQAYKQFRCANNSVLEFVRQALILGKGGQVSKQELWESYKKFSSRFQFSPYSSDAFFKKLYSNYPNVRLGETRIRVDGRLTYMVKNVKISEIQGEGWNRV